MNDFEPTLRDVLAVISAARRDVERIVGTQLSNVSHYAVLGRFDAMAADVSRVVADALTAPLHR